MGILLLSGSEIQPAKIREKNTMQIKKLRHIITTPHRQTGDGLREIGKTGQAQGDRDHDDQRARFLISSRPSAQGSIVQNRITGLVATIVEAYTHMYTQPSN